MARDLSRFSMEDFVENRGEFTEAQIYAFKKVFTDSQVSTLETASKEFMERALELKKEAAALLSKEEMERRIAEGGGEPEGLADMCCFELVKTIFLESRGWFEMIWLFIKYFG